METPNLLQAKIRKLEAQLRESNRERDALRAVLFQHIELTKRDGDDQAAESRGEFADARPCICPTCRTYRAALWVLEDAHAS